MFLEAFLQPLTYRRPLSHSIVTDSRIKSDLGSIAAAATVVTLAR